MIEVPQDPLPRRRGDEELLRVRDSLHRVANSLQELVGGHISTSTKVDSLVVTLEEMRPDVKLIPALKWRVTLLERVIYGACGIILMAVITAIIRGVVYVPVMQQLGPK